MNWLIAAYMLYGAAVVLCVRMIQYNVEIHPKMPEKVPIHFGFRGEPDKWMKKGAFTKYYLPATALFTVAFIFYCFIVLPLKDEGEVMPEFSALGSVISLATAYLMFSLNKGTAQVALGIEKKIWKFIKFPLIVFTASIFLIPAFAYITSREPEPIEAVLCSAMENGKPANEKSVFSTKDERVYLWMKFKRMYYGVIRFEWYEPDGKLFFENKYEYDEKRPGGIKRYWSYIGPSGQGDEQKRGVWKVKVFHDEKFVLEKEFEIR